MEIIEGLEAMLDNNFTGTIVCKFDEGSTIEEYTVEVLNGKLIFANEDYKEHFIYSMINQSIQWIFFNRI